MQPSISVKQSIGPTTRGRLAGVLAQREAKRKELFCDPILSLTEVSRALGDCSYGYIRGLLKSGKLEAFRLGKNGHWRVRQSALSAMLAQAEKSGGAKHAL